MTREDHLLDIVRALVLTEAGRKRKREWAMWHLHSIGYSFEKIGQHFGISGSRASQLAKVEAAFRKSIGL